MKKRTVSLLISLCMLISLFPSAALAAEGEVSDPPTAAETLTEEKKDEAPPLEGADETKKEEKPAQGEDPADEEEPVNGEKPVIEAEEKPADGEKEPADEEENSADEEENSADEEENSADEEEKPADGEEELGQAELFSEEPIFFSVERTTALAADDDSRDYPGTVTATAPSYQGGRGPELALDGDTGTSWHTNWDNGDLSNDDANRYIQLELDSATALAALRYLPIGGGQYDNGVVTQYRVEVSANGSDYTAVGSGTWQRGSDWQLAVFDAVVMAKYVRLYGVETYGDTSRNNYFMSAAEIRLVRGTESMVPEPELDNLALLEGVAATAGNSDSDAHTPAKAIDGVKDNNSRWGTEVNDQWFQLDLHRLCEVKEIKLFWEQTSVTSYTVKVSANGSDWESVYTQGERVPDSKEQTLSINKNNVRFIRMEGIHFDNSNGTYPSASIWEFEVYGTAGERLPDNLLPPSEALLNATPAGNLCRPSDNTTVTPSASSQEADTVAAAKAIDGTIEGKGWSSAVNDGPHFLQVDLGKERAVSAVKIFWERGNIKNYKLEGSMDGSSWVKLYEKTDNTPLTREQLDTVITFDAVALRYLRVTTTSHQTVGVKRDGSQSIAWNSVCILELEAYKKLEATAADALKELTFQVRDGMLTPENVPEGFVVNACAANLEQVVGPDGTVYQPLVDTVVELDVTVVSEDGTDMASTNPNNPIRFTVPGQKTANEGNEKPPVIPEIMEWYSSASQQGKRFTLTRNASIVAPAELNTVAVELQKDIKELFGLELKILSGGAANGDISLVLGSGSKVAGFDGETYFMEIGDRVTITATGDVGAYWGTRSLLQAMKLSGDLSIAQGTARDYPEFPVRGFILDVGRKPMSMDKLRDFARNMAWYKMNDLHIHLNDNLIFMEDYGVNSGNYQTTYDQANAAYSAFRLESGLAEEPDAVAPLAARDYHYTKGEYRQFVESSADMGVTVVSEIDVPAHAKAVTDAFPSLRLFGCSGHPWNDHLDLTNKYDQSLAKVQEIFDDYIDSGVFGDTVHFGADEYYDSHPSYRRFVKDMIAYLREKRGGAIQSRVWGSLSSMSGGSGYAVTPEEAEGVQMNVWNTTWADPREMYELGFDIINTVDGNLYIVPGADYYFDYLNKDYIYNTWTPNNVGGTWLPASSEKMVGAAYAIWNDLVDTRANGMSEVEVFDRFFDALPYISVKMWGEGAEKDRTIQELTENVAVLGCAPGSNPYYEVPMAQGAGQYFRYDFTGLQDLSGNGRDLTTQNAVVKSGALSLSGNESYASTGLERLPLGSKLSFRVYKNSGGGKEQILFEGDHAYGEYAIKALPVEGKPDKWKLGFSRELYDYEFDVELPVGEEVSLTLLSGDETVRLSVNGDSPTEVSAVGKFVSKPGSNTPFRGKTGITRAAFQLPVARIGSKTNALEGYVKDVYASDATAGSPVEGGAYDIPTEEYAGALDGNHQGSGDSADDAAKAIDNNTETMWHTQWSYLCPMEDSWIQIELQTKQWVSSLRYLPRSSGNNGIIQTYDILVSEDGSSWETVVTDGAFAGTSGWQSAEFPARETKFVRLLAKNTMGTSSTQRFASAVELRLARAPSLDEPGKTAVTLSESAYPMQDGKAEPKPLVTFDGAALDEGKDYTLSYENNTAVGTGRVTVTGAGIYTGQASVEFQVEAEAAKTDLSGAQVSFDRSGYLLTDGKAEPTPTVLLNGESLVRGLDYTVSYENNTAVGTATVTITGVGEYTGTATADFEVVEKRTLEEGKTAILLDQTSYVLQNGKAQPKPVVKHEGVLLTEGEDYTLSYADNTLPGTGRVIVTGMGDYTGTVSAFFTVVDKLDLSEEGRTTIEFDKASYPAVGGKAEPLPSVRYDGQLLVRNQDYTLSYLNNIYDGEATVIVTGIGSYTGSATATFLVTGGVTKPLGKKDLSEKGKTHVSFPQESYPLENGKAEPLPIVKYGVLTLVRNVDYTVSYLNNTVPGTGQIVITGKGNYTGSVTAEFTIQKTEPSNPGGMSGGGGSGGTGGVTTKRPDGSEVKVTTDRKTGAVTATAKYPNGVNVKSEIKGNETTAQVTFPSDVTDKTAVVIHTTARPTVGQVAVIVHPDGTEELVKTSLATDEGLRVILSGSARLRIIDNTKIFSDVAEDNWAQEAVSFVTSREIFNGTGSGTFTPQGDMSRAMVCTVLANLEGVNTSGGETWYDKALDWAKEKGISDGSNPNATVTREQLAVMLYRYIGAPEMEAGEMDFADADQVSDWAVRAMAWAVEKGILKGRDGIYLAPQATASRAEVAVMMQRYMALL